MTRVEKWGDWRWRQGQNDFCWPGCYCLRAALNRSSLGDACCTAFCLTSLYKGSVQYCLRNFQRRQCNALYWRKHFFHTRKEGLLSHCISTANSNVADNIKDMEGSNLAQEIKHQRWVATACVAYGLFDVWNLCGTVQLKGSAAK